MNVKVIFPNRLVSILGIKKEIKLSEVDNIRDVYSKLSSLNEKFKERLFKDKKINRNIGIIIGNELINPDDYVLREGVEIKLQLPIAGG